MRALQSDLQQLARAIERTVLSKEQDKTKSIDRQVDGDALARDTPPAAAALEQAQDTQLQLVRQRDSVAAAGHGSTQRPGTQSASVWGQANTQGGVDAELTRLEAEIEKQKKVTQVCCIEMLHACPWTTPMLSDGQ
jgi:hypothetical protein